MRDPRLTWANSLSASRFLLALALAVAIAYDYWTWGAMFFTVACFTDAFDGRIARRQGTVSNFGGKLDHTADGFFVTTGLVATAFHESTTFVLPMLIVIAFVLYFVSGRRKTNQPLRASKLGKVNGVAYFVLLGFAIGQQLLSRYLGFLEPIIYYASWALVVSTLALVSQHLLYAVKAR